VFSNHRGRVSTQAATLTVVKPTPVIDWPAPPPLTVGRPLPATDLDARAEPPANLVAQPAPPTSGPPAREEVSGTYSYQPSAGTILPAGIDQLTVTFTPTDTEDYNPVTATTAVHVGPSIVPVTTPPARSPSPIRALCPARAAIAYWLPRRLRARTTQILTAHVIDSRGRPVRIARRRGPRVTAPLAGLPAGRYRLRLTLRVAGRGRTITAGATRCRP
jgi:hypothetical protein